LPRALFFFFFFEIEKRWDRKCRVSLPRSDGPGTRPSDAMRLRRKASALARRRQGGASVVDGRPGSTGLRLRGYAERKGRSRVEAEANRPVADSRWIRGTIGRNRAGSRRRVFIVCGRPARRKPSIAGQPPAGTARHPFRARRGARLERSTTGAPSGNRPARGHSSRARSEKGPTDGVLGSSAKKGGRMTRHADQIHTGGSDGKWKENRGYGPSAGEGPKTHSVTTH